MKGRSTEVSADNDSSFLFYLLQRSYYLETMCDAPLNYSTMIINSAQVAFLARSSPEGLHKTRSAPDSASEIHYETRSSRRETLSWGTYLALKLDDITFLVSFHCSLCLCPICLFFFFFTPQRSQDSVLVLNLLSHPDEWPVGLRQATSHLLFCFFPLLKLISHFSPATWAQWHHLRIYIF